MEKAIQNVETESYKWIKTTCINSLTFSTLLKAIKKIQQKKKIFSCFQNQLKEMQSSYIYINEMVHMEQEMHVTQYVLRYSLLFADNRRDLFPIARLPRHHMTHWQE